MRLRAGCVEWSASTHTVPGPRLAHPIVSRYEKLALATVISTILLVAMGVIVRATGSGMGCPDWPLCNNQLIPSTTDYKPWLEWIHRDIAVIIGFEILGLAYLAIRHYRDRRSILWPTLVAVVLGSEVDLPSGPGITAVRVHEPA